MIPYVAEKKKLAMNDCLLVFRSSYLLPMLRQGWI